MTTQHKTNPIRELKRENNRLRKQIQKLNGAINSLSFHGLEIDQVEEKLERLEELEKKSNAKEVQAQGCPECKSALEEKELGKHILVVCTGSGCNYRERKQRKQIE